MYMCEIRSHSTTIVNNSDEQIEVFVDCSCVNFCIIYNHQLPNNGVLSNMFLLLKHCVYRFMYRSCSSQFCAVNATVVTLAHVFL